MCLRLTFGVYFGLLCLKVSLLIILDDTTIDHPMRDLVASYLISYNSYKLSFRLRVHKKEKVSDEEETYKLKERNDLPFFGMFLSGIC